MKKGWLIFLCLMLSVAIAVPGLAAPEYGELDEKGATFILAQGWEAEGEALAVMNRLARAASFDIVHL
ncbi:MAG: hypothetical protein E7324_00120 [Clostridiales bacterium]|nr:hypothetical protein [Clostridiales bacterium]